MMLLRVTPLPIPNRMVKPQKADGTAWETEWESRRLPGENKDFMFNMKSFCYVNIFVQYNNN